MLRLGDKCHYSRRLVRQSEFSDRGYKQYKRWVHYTSLESKEGILAGVRTFADGYISYEGDEGWVWSGPTKTLTVAIIYYDIRRKPDFVLWSDIQEVAEVQ